MKNIETLLQTCFPPTQDFRSQQLLRLTEPRSLGSWRWLSLAVAVFQCFAAQPSWVLGPSRTPIGSSGPVMSPNLLQRLSPERWCGISWRVRPTNGMPTPSRHRPGRPKDPKGHFGNTTYQKSGCLESHCGKKLEETPELVNTYRSW